MGVCAICGKKQVLTKEHTIPNGLLNRLENLPQGRRPNDVWTPQISKMVHDENHAIKDTCDECQLLFHKAYDNRVDEAFNIMMDLQDGFPPFTTIVEEPWFTLYLLRIFWSLIRCSKQIVLNKSLTDPIVSYARDSSTSISILRVQ